jgi:hypothetical protein
MMNLTRLVDRWVKLHEPLLSSYRYADYYFSSIQIEIVCTELVSKWKYDVSSWNDRLRWTVTKRFIKWHNYRLMYTIVVVVVVIVAWYKRKKVNVIDASMSISMHSCKSKIVFIRACICIQRRSFTESKANGTNLMRTIDQVTEYFWWLGIKSIWQSWRPIWTVTRDLFLLFRSLLCLNTWKTLDEKNNYYLTVIRPSS